MAAERRYLQDDQETDEAEVNALVRFRTQAYAALRQRLATRIEADAITSFENAYLDASSQANVESDTQAEACQASAGASVRFGTSSEAGFSVVRQARLFASVATATAVEEAFQARSSAQEQALVSARQTLRASVEAGHYGPGIAQAQAQYAQAVRAALAAETRPLGLGDYERPERGSLGERPA